MIRRFEGYEMDAHRKDPLSDPGSPSSAGMMPIPMIGIEIASTTIARFRVPIETEVPS